MKFPKAGDIGICSCIHIKFREINTFTIKVNFFFTDNENCPFCSTPVVLTAFSGCYLLREVLYSSTKLEGPDKLSFKAFTHSIQLTFKRQGKDSAGENRQMRE